MLDNKHKREVEKVLQQALKAHKERVQILRMSQFGIIEITRQRQRASIKSSMFEDCKHCMGSGLVKSSGEKAAWQLGAAVLVALILGLLAWRGGAFGSAGEPPAEASS